MVSVAATADASAVPTEPQPSRPSLPLPHPAWGLWASDSPFLLERRYQIGQTWISALPSISVKRGVPYSTVCPMSQDLPEQKTCSVHEPIYAFSHAHVWECGGRPRVDIGCLPPLAPSSFNESGSFTESRTQWFQLV